MTAGRTILRLRTGSRRAAATACVLWMLWLAAGTAAAQPAALGINPANGRRDCAVCHTEWVDSFDRPGAVLLIDKPVGKLVAESATCLGCHDGSVGDSRKMVWLDHGHQAKNAIPADMKVPENLPLVNGKIACRTCHTAHATPATGAEALADTFFLRLPNDSSQLCKACHGDKSNGKEHGSHPLGPMKAALPENLKIAGAHAGKDGKTVVCQSCHTPHGQKAEHLLVLGTESSQLCASCHDQLQPGRWTADASGAVKGSGHAHPLNPPLKTQEQKNAIQAMGTKIGPGNTLICLSCHKPHNAPGGRAILAQTLQNSQLCLSCHSDRAVVLDSKHDLRKVAPTAVNLHKETAVQSGPCGACHTFHSYALDRQPTLADPSGLCASCHSKGHSGEKAGGLGTSHPTTIDLTKLPALAAGAAPLLRASATPGGAPSLMCQTCHDPHLAKNDKFLRASKDQVCGTCHAKELASLAGPHDLTKPDPTKAAAPLRNGLGKSPAETGKCGFCHSMHQGQGKILWAGTNQAPRGPDDLCVQCHRQGSVATNKPAPAFSHPTGPAAMPTTRPAGLPTFDAAGQRTAAGFMACSSCHDPHADARLTHGLLRVNGPPSATCVQCHTPQAAMAGNTHDVRKDPAAWPKESALGWKGLTPSAPLGHLPPGQSQSGEQDLCMTCHRPHGNDADRRLWAVAPLKTASALAAPSDRVCLGCHQQNDWGTRAAPPPAPASRQPATTQPSIASTTQPLIASTTQPAVPAGVPAVTPGTASVAAPPLAAKPTQPAAVANAGARPAARGRPVAPASGSVPELPTGADLSEYIGGPVGANPALKPGATTQPAVPRQPKGRMLHPHTMPSDSAVAKAATGVLPLSHVAMVQNGQNGSAPSAAGTDALMCKTCHDPHARPAGQSLLRLAASPSQQAAPDAGSAQTCFTCHAAARPVVHSMHAQSMMPKELLAGANGVDGANGANGDRPGVQLCGPCHAVHATGTSSATLLWANPASKGGFGSVEPQTTEQRCLSCHDNATAKKPQAIVQHPDVTANLVNQLTSTRLSAARDQHVPMERITCATCHLPHGREIPGAVPPADATKAQRSASKPMLRPEVPAQFCASCHGPNAPRLFLYYHRPELRAGLSKPKGE